jgi:4-amino-4-deoxy-L-arabinose transferase-like glycosyltransferase
VRSDPPTPTSSPPPLRHDRPFLALATLCLLHLAWLAPRLLVRDLNLDYPFMDGDSWDWIANGLFLGGADVRYSGRPPLVPLLLALLDRAGALSLFPLLNVAAFHAALLALYRTAARLSGRPAAAAATLVLLVNHGLQTLALQVMADVLAAVLLVAAFALFTRAESRPRDLLSTGLLVGLSSLAQPAALLTLPAAALALLAARRTGRRTPLSLLVLAALLAVLPQALWAAYKLAAFGTAGDLLARHTHLVRFHLDAVGHYAWGFVALLGLPAALLALAGAGLAIRRPWSAPRLAALGFAASLAVFFVLFYDFNAQRFLVYALAPLGLFLAEGAAALARLRRPAVWAGAVLLCLLGSAQPRPTAGNDGTWIALWSLPPLFLHGSVQPAPTGSATLQLSTARLVIRPVADLWHDSLWAQVAALDRTHAQRHPAASTFAADRSAVYLASPEEASRRYRLVTRLGNVLRKRVVLVPHDHLSPALAPLGVAPLGTVARGAGETGEIALFRVRLPGADGTWLLAADPALAAAGPSLAPRPPAPLSPTLQDGLARAQAIRSFLAGSDSYVGILGCDARSPADPAQLALPFLLETTEVHVVGAADLIGARALLAGVPVLAERRIGSALVQRIRLFGRPSGVVICDAPPPAR